MRLDQILCTGAAEGMLALPDGCVDLTVTSPPYDRLRSFGGHTWDFVVFTAIAEELWRVTAKGGVVVWVVADEIVSGSYSGTAFRHALYFMDLGFNMHDELIMLRRGSRWPARVRYSNSLEFAFVFSKGRPRAIQLIRDKANKKIGRFQCFNRRESDGRIVKAGTSRPVAPFGVRGPIWEYPAGASTTTKDKYAFEHSALMPEPMARDLIVSWSRPGDLVLDPMCGAGTTCKLALLNDRRYIGIEIHEPYYRLALRRMRDARIEYRRRLDDWLTTRTEAGSCSVQLNGLEGAQTFAFGSRTIAPNTVVHGDCIDLIPRLPDRSVSLVVTSPPYADKRQGHYPGVPEAFYPEFTVRWMAKLWPKLTDDGSVLIVIDPHVDKGGLSDYVRRTSEALRDFGWTEHRPQIWFKPDMMPLGHKWWPRHCYEEVLWFSKGRKPYCDARACGKESWRLAVGSYQWSDWSNGHAEQNEGIARVGDVIVLPVGANEPGIDHPARFPVALAERLIKTFCPEKGSVLDPFCGSGSTLVAAAKSGRSYCGFDLVAAYCEMARRRLGRANNDGSLPEAS